MQLSRCLRLEDRFDHKHQLASALVAVNHRWRVFRLRGNKTDRATDRIGYPVHTYGQLVPIMKRPDYRFWHEGADLDILRRQQHHDWAPRFNPFAGTV